MAGSRLKKSDKHRDVHFQTGRCELPASEGITLVHDPDVHEGKTRGMAKGLFLSYRNEPCTGESAGLGLPVWKTSRLTSFPKLVSMRSNGLNTLQKNFRMDRVVAWQVSGKRAPAWFHRAMELLVGRYMKSPYLQQCMLRIRDGFLSACSVESSMEQGTEQGLCRVCYDVGPQGVVIQVDASALHGQGRLIMLNELDGASFNRVRMTDLVWTDEEIPAWIEVPFETVLECTRLGIGISLSSGRYGDLTGSRLYCGREMASGLNWAGLALTSSQQFLTYQVNFHRITPQLTEEGRSRLSGNGARLSGSEFCSP